MAFKLHLGPDEPDDSGVLWVHLVYYPRNNVHLRFPRPDTHGLRIRADGGDITFQVSEFASVLQLPHDGRGSIACRGSGGPWSFGESAPEIPQDQVQALQNHLKEALCLH